MNIEEPELSSEMTESLRSVEVENEDFDEVLDELSKSSHSQDLSPSEMSFSRRPSAPDIECVFDPDDQ